MSVSIDPHLARRAGTGKKPELYGWKQIAAYLRLHEKTARRWELERGMPVRRPPGKPKGSVFAYRSEIDAWLEAPASGAEPSMATPDRLQAPPVETPLPPANVWDGNPLPALPGAQAHPAPIHGRFLPRPFWFYSAGLTILALALLVWRFSGPLAASSSTRPPALVLPRATGHVPSPDAEQLVLRARYLWNVRTADSIAEAIDAYSQAIAKDPFYADAYAGLAESYDLQPEFAKADPAESYARAKEAAARAIQLNPNLASAHRALAFALFFWDWNIVDSDAEFKRAIELEPSSALTHLWYASALQSRLEGAECIRQAEEAFRLDPGSPEVAADTAFFQAVFGDFDAGVKDLREIEKTQPTLASPSYFLRELDFDEGNFPAYIDDARRYAAITGDANDQALADAVARGWARDGVRGILNARARVLSADFRRGNERAMALGETWVLLRQPEKALPYFRAAYDRHCMLVLVMLNCKWWKALESHPGYAELAAQVRNLPRGHIARPVADPIYMSLPAMVKTATERD